MNTEFIISLISSGISLIGVLGGGTWLYIRQDRTAKDLANENTAIGQWQELLKEYKGECTEKDSKIDKLYAELKKHRDEKVELRKKITDLEVENAKLTLTHCEVKGCVKRVPPTGY